jgi:8-oxo-dGTP pyrophosphatase MutT (NUDIX family)
VDDPRLLQLKQRLATHAATQSERDPDMREAAVALLIRPRAQLELLLIKRATHERDPWSGHMALPGGRRDASDADLIDTAMREAHEEVGIALSRADFICALDDVAPRTPRLPPIIIAPFVFVVPADAATNIDAREVDAAVWVPVNALRDPTAASEILIELEGGSRAFPSFQYGEYVIWGLTHRILAGFLELTVGIPGA